MKVLITQRRFGLATLLLPLVAVGQIGKADPAQDQAQQLMQIHQATPQQSSQLMNQKLIKTNVQNQSGPSALTQARRQLKDVEEKSLFRCALQNNRLRDLSHPTLRKQLEKDCGLSGRSQIQYDDRPEALVDKFVVKNIAEVDKYRSAQLAESPWSDDYWAIYAGILGKRYAEGQPGSNDWKENFDYVKSNPVSKYLGTSKVNSLSPGEKYDLLLGIQDPIQTAGSITKYSWDEGQGYYQSSGKVEPWMGICHGWAPAAFMDDRPVSAVETMSADGQTKLTFYPSDLKALTSMLWANSQSNTKFVGRRCNVKDPRQDENGRILEADCVDNNPATVLLVAINQIAIAKRSFVLDATYDYEVWNQPVHAYNISYFNPSTGRSSQNLTDAMTDYSSFSAKDKFKKYRSPNVKSVVGVNMQLQYVVETSPSTRATDAPRYDSINTAHYVFDLELDAKGDIIGGEWYNNTHPDFLWLPQAGQKVAAYGDSRVRSSWNVGEVLPSDWQNAGKFSNQYGQPMGKIIRAMIAKSRSR